MIEAVTEENLPEFENYIKLNPRGSYLQSSLWARQNPAWHWRGYIRRNEYKRVTGAVSFLVRDIPLLPYQIIYAGKGPIYDMGDTASLRDLLAALQEAAREEQAAIVRVDPPVEDSDKELMSVYEAYDYEKLKHRGRAPFHSRHCWILNIGKNSWARLQKTFSREQAQNLRIALRHDVEIKRGGKALAGAFGRMIEHSALRDSKKSESSEFFSGFMDTFGDRAKIYLACKNHRPIAGLLMVLTGGRYECVARADLSDPTLHAMSLLQAAVLQTAADSGYDAVLFPVGAFYPESELYQIFSGLGAKPDSTVGEMDWYCKPLIGMASKLILRAADWIDREQYFLKIR